MRKLVSAASLVITLVSTGAVAQTQRGFGDVTSVVLVEVPVTVSSDGEPVRGLKAEDFEVFDGRKKQTVVGFDVIDLARAEQAQAEGVRVMLPAAGRRHFLFLFDLSFSDPIAVVRAREAARDLVFNGLHAEDVAAVAVYTVQQGPRILTGFTQDRRQLEIALETLGNPQLAKGSGDPLGLVFSEIDEEEEKSRHAATPEVRAEVDQAIRTYVQDLTSLVQRDNRQDLQNKVTGMTRQLADLARMLGSVEGRKYVVLLSEGFDDSLLVGTAGRATATGGAADAIGANDPAAGGSVMAAPTNSTDQIAFGGGAQSSTDEMFGRSKVVNDMSRMLQQFREANCTIQAVDIGGLRAGGDIRGGSSGQNALSQMASETGGEVFRNFNNLSSAMDSMLAKTSVTYLLAIQPDDLKSDGKFHRLKVRLKNGPKGAELVHRPGFFAPVPLSQQSPLARQLLTSSEIFGEVGGQIATAVFATAYPVAGERSYTPVLVEIDGRSLAAGTKGKALPLEVYAYALDRSGSVHDFFTQSLGLDLAKVGEALKQSGVKYFGHFDLPPGDYEARVLVRNLETAQSSLQVVPINVPAWEAGAPSLSLAMVPEPPGRWLMIREPLERQRQVAYPFQLREGPFIPAAAPTIPASGDIALPVAAFNWPAGGLSIKVRLKDAAGNELGNGFEVQQVDRITGAVPGGDALVLKAHTSGLLLGPHVLELQVTDPATGKQARVSTPLTVVKSAS